MIRLLLCWLHRNTYQIRRASRNDSLTLAAQVGKPQAPGFATDRTRIDRRAHVIQIARMPRV